MKRRNFLHRIGLATGGMYIGNKLNAAHFPALPNTDFEINGFNDLLSKEGMVMVRLNYSSTDPGIIQQHEGKIIINNGSLHRTKSYFFHKDTDEMDGSGPSLNIMSYPGSVDVVVLWIKDGSPRTSITFPVGKGSQTVSIEKIIEDKDAVFIEENAMVTVSYLLDKEIGEIDPRDVGINDPGDRFVFTVMADPQGGNPFAHEQVQTRMRIHNAFIDESVRLVNETKPKPAFNIVIGDIVDGQGHHADFRAMNDRLAKTDVPTLYEIGNHETRYRSVFTPGYNMSAFDNYFAAQKEFNGMDKLLYSFNLGKWHFIVWPDPLRSNFWETHPHYFTWLEDDLKKYSDRPAILFQHVPVHPVGILPLINYAESVDVKRLLLDILSSNGNVKYVLSGHVHIPMKASVKTAVSYKGIKFINLPAAGYRPRAFGEEDFNGGPTQGIAMMEIEDDIAKIHYKTVVNEQFSYPDPSPFDDAKSPLWLKHKWEIAKDPELKNGDFKDDLKYWHRRYVYEEDKDPSNICETRKNTDGKSFLYLFNKSRGYNKPGQDRLPQSINRICQVIRQEPGTIPLISLKFWIDPAYFIPENLAGAYIWLEGFEKGLKRMNIVYSNSYVHWNLGGNQSQIRTVLPVHLDISAAPGEWKNLFINPYNDFLNYTEDQDPQIQNTDAFAINFGVWTLNEGYKKHAAAGFSDVSLEFRHINNLYESESNVNGQQIPKKEQKFLWWHGVKHPAGDHQSIREDLNKYL
ncbi:MAG: metallophosphoesterase [Bacteroidales bacterium]|nr:metallophosphoesterase [Bacteroidales bacterium]